MQRKLSILCLAICMITFIPHSQAQQGKSEFQAGYGYWSIYSLANGKPFSNSTGVPTFTYRYYLSKQVTLGIGAGYENITNFGSWTTVAAEVTVAYLDTRDAFTRIRIYGAASYGVGIFSDARNQINETDASGPKPYGFQATPFGVRVGRQVAVYAELGCGYKGLINCGLDLRVPRRLGAREDRINY
jgi:hypothetical protein